MINNDMTDTTFINDPLQMLRVIRHAAECDLELEHDVAQTIKMNAVMIKTVPQERITEEILNAFNSAVYKDSLPKTWFKLNLFDKILYPIEDSDAEEHIFNLGEVIRSIQWNGGGTPELYFWIFYRYGSLPIDKMKLPKRFINKVFKINGAVNLFTKTELSDYNARKFGLFCGNDYNECFKAIWAECNLYFGRNYYEWGNSFESVIRRLEAEGTMFNGDTKLPINGNDIMKLFNLEPSKLVKGCLKYCWNEYCKNPNLTKMDLENKLMSLYNGNEKRNNSMKSKKLYLSGPMSICKDKETWERNFQRYEDIFTEMGYEVVNPAKNEILPTYEECLKHSISQELQCDCIFFMENAILSKGARLEYEVAKACGLEIVLLDENISFTDNYENSSNIKSKEYVNKP